MWVAPHACFSTQLKRCPVVGSRSGAMIFFGVPKTMHLHHGIENARGELWLRTLIWLRGRGMHTWRGSESERPSHAF